MHESLIVIKKSRKSRSVFHRTQQTIHVHLSVVTFNNTNSYFTGGYQGTEMTYLSNNMMVKVGQHLNQHLCFVMCYVNSFLVIQLQVTSKV